MYSCTRNLIGIAKPKQMHILLEGATEQYAKLYESSMKVAKDLFFRPMMPNDPDILVSGTIVVTNNTQSRRTGTGHLVCSPVHCSSFLGLICMTGLLHWWNVGAWSNGSRFEG